jgi:NADH-quinone oxidoreductase subunit C
MTDATPDTTVESPPPAPEPELVHGHVVTQSHGQPVVHCAAADLLTLCTALRDEGFEMCIDVTATDYLMHPGHRSLPADIAPERFEVVVNLLSMAGRRRIRIRAQVPEDAPVAPSLFGLWPGTEALEREVFDLMGIRFDGHPDLTRIMMPEDWEGHPLRKDYAIGKIPVQFKAAPRAGDR